MAKAKQITQWLVGPLTAHSLVSQAVPLVLSQQQAYTLALKLGALNDVGGRPHLSPHHLLFASVTYFLHGLLLSYQPQKDERL